jgi:hypothetical protein
MSSLQMVVADNQSRQPCGGKLGQCGVMVGQPNTENERRLVSMEWRLVDVEDIVGDLAKTMDGLDDFCLKVDESQRRSEEVTKMRMSE